MQAGRSTSTRSWIFEPVKVKQQWVGARYKVRIDQPMFYYLVDKSQPVDSILEVVVTMINQATQNVWTPKPGNSVLITEVFPLQKGVPLQRTIIRWRDA
jgi:hypothetical protein